VNHPRILGIGTANPPVRLTQEQTFHAAGHQGDRIRKIFLNSDIGHRQWWTEVRFGPGRFWGLQTGPNPTDRAKFGSKRHLICDGRGIPLVVQITGANRHDSRQALSLVDAIPLLQGERGRPRHRPDCVLGDRGYDAEASAKVYLPAISCPCSLGATLSMAADLGDGDGWSNGPLFGLTSSGGCAFATKSGPIPTRGCCCSAVRSSAGTFCREPTDEILESFSFLTCSHWGTHLDCARLACIIEILVYATASEGSRWWARRMRTCFGCSAQRWRALGPLPGIEATKIWEEIMFSPRCQHDPVQLAMLCENTPP
jgi:hypothetical protein